MSESTQEEEKPDQKNEEEELPFDAVDLMLEGNLQAQINYSMVKALAKAFDEKASILINAEENFKPEEEESFAEVAMPEIEAMAQAVVDGCVDFSKIRFWEACETAEVAWDETKNEKTVKLLNGSLTETPLILLEKAIVYFQTWRKLKAG
jgi:hypothetical protein